MDGKKVALNIQENLKRKINKLKKKNIIPTLAIIMIGNNPAPAIYIKNKKKICADLNIKYKEYIFDQSSSFEYIKATVTKLNENKDIHGIIIQTPIPEHLNTQDVLNLVDPNKDVDGLTEFNQAKLYLNKETIIPCTPLGIMELFKYYKINLTSKHVVIINRSRLVGKPLAHLLLHQNATVTVCHSKTKDIDKITKLADIIICAVGKVNFITKDMVKNETIIVDVGINHINNKTLGDVDYNEIIKKCPLMTKVPGGVGPMTVTMLISNLIDLCEQKNK